MAPDAAMMQYVTPSVNICWLVWLGHIAQGQPTHTAWGMDQLGLPTVVSSTCFVYNPFHMSWNLSTHKAMQIARQMPAWAFGKGGAPRYISMQWFSISIPTVRPHPGWPWTRLLYRSPRRIHRSRGDGVSVGFSVVFVHWLWLACAILRPHMGRARPRNRGQGGDANRLEARFSEHNGAWTCHDMTMQELRWQSVASLSEALIRRQQDD